jgi:hypothetical protein
MLQQAPCCCWFVQRETRCSEARCMSSSQMARSWWWATCGLAFCERPSGSQRLTRLCARAARSWSDFCRLQCFFPIDVQTIAPNPSNNSHLLSRPFPARYHNPESHIIFLALALAERTCYFLKIGRGIQNFDYRVNSTQVISTLASPKGTSIGTPGAQTCFIRLEMGKACLVSMENPYLAY